jgi:septum site-determining protein MinD
MVQVVCVHSFRGGTGKSNLTANLAAQLARRGQHVGVVDTDIQSPGIHVLFGLAGADVGASLNDHLWRGRPIAEVAHDVTGEAGPGRIHLVPSSTQAGEISRVLREGYDAQLLIRALRGLADELALDALLIDTHPGLQEETLLSLVVADTLLILLRPDRQDYEGTGITVRVAEDLDVPRTALVVNKVPPALDRARLGAEVERTYGRPVLATLPHADEMMALASEGVFSLRHPAHPLAEQFAAMAQYLLQPDGAAS